MGLLNGSRTIVYCGSKSWKLASLSSTYSKSQFSSIDSHKKKPQINSCSPSLLNDNVSALKSIILQCRFNSSDTSPAKSSGFFGPEAAIDKSGKVNRWSMFVPAFLTHLCKFDINLKKTS